MTKRDIGSWMICIGFFVYGVSRLMISLGY